MNFDWTPGGADRYWLSMAVAAILFLLAWLRTR